MARTPFCGLRKFAAITLVFVFLNGSDVFALEQPSGQTLKRETISNLLSVAKLCLEFQQACQLSDIKKRRRQFTYAAFNSAATSGGLVAAIGIFGSQSVYETGPNLKIDEKGKATIEIKGQPNHIAGGANAAQLYPQVIAQEVNGVGNAFELSVNLLKRIKASREKRDPKSALGAVQSKFAEIDKSIAGLRAIALTDDANMLECVERELKEKFRRTYITARKEFAFQNSLEMLDFARNSIGATGNQISVGAGYANNNRLNGLGAALSLGAAGLIIARPWLSQGVSKVNECLARRRVAKVLGSEGPTQEAAALRNASASDEVIGQLQSLIEEEKVADKIAEEQSSKRAHLELGRNTGYAPTKIVNSTLGVVANYSHGLDATERNRLGTAGAITYTAGQSMNFLELLRERVMDERSEKKLQAQELTTAQMSKTHLEVLDALDRRLSADN